MYTIYHFYNKKKITPDYSKSAAMGFFSKGLKNEFDIAVVNEPSVFEPLKFYYMYIPTNTLTLAILLPYLGN